LKEKTVSKIKAKKKSAKPSKEMTYETADRILPIIGIPDPCPISVIVADDYVFLNVAGRDIQWDRKTGDFVGAGTCVGDWSE